MEIGDLIGRSPDHEAIGRDVYGVKTGETFQLAEAKDLVVVRTVDNAPLETLSLSSQSRDIMPSLLPIAAFPEANVMVYRCIATEEKTATAMRKRR